MFNRTYYCRRIDLRTIPIRLTLLVRCIQVFLLLSLLIYLLKLKQVHVFLLAYKHALPIKESLVPILLHVLIDCLHCDYG